MPVFDKSEQWRKRWSRRLAGAIVALLLLALAAGGLKVALRLYRIYVSAESIGPPALNFRASRPIFPYSIIPGGVYSPDEVMASMNGDPLVREHYKDVQVEHLVLMRLPAQLQAYLSFRKDNKVYWTSRKLTLPRGELVLSDGKNMLRVRCGNRISKTKRRPTTTAIDLTWEQTSDRFSEYRPPDDAPGPGGELTPEPASIWLYASGLFLMLGWAAMRRRWGANGNK